MYILGWAKNPLRAHGVIKMSQDGVQIGEGGSNRRSVAMFPPGLTFLQHDGGMPPAIVAILGYLLVLAVAVSAIMWAISSIAPKGHDRPTAPTTMQVG
jgi:hypothetical protein